MMPPVSGALATGMTVCLDQIQSRLYMLKKLDAGLDVSCLAAATVKSFGGHHNPEAVARSSMDSGCAMWCLSSFRWQYNTTQYRLVSYIKEKKQ